MRRVNITEFSRKGCGRCSGGGGKEAVQDDVDCENPVEDRVEQEVVVVAAVAAVENAVERQQ